MKNAIQRAKVLLEALPYIRKFYGETIVIKYGGSAMESPELKSSTIQDIVLLWFVGMKPVVVHGGGKKITEAMKKVGKEAVFINGHRVTDEETLEITEMVLTGLINKEIVNLINTFGGKAVGISGKDAMLIKAKQKPGAGNLGFVGIVESINPEIIIHLTEGGYIPVISPLGVDSKGTTFNINADIVAGKIASALKARKLIYMTDVDGIMTDPSNKSTLIHSITKRELESIIADGTLKGGMIPKAESAIEAVSEGVKQVHIINGTIEHSLLLEILTEEGIGTVVFND